MEELGAIKKLNFNVCMQCGKCTGSCPVFPKSKLNPRRLMLETAYLISPLTMHPPLNIYEKSEIWDCTTCSTCSYRCPREVEPMDVLIGLRGLLIEQGCVPSTLGDALEGVYKYGNPWGISRSKRSEWAKDLKVKYVSEGEKAELLYFVGCAASYDSRAQEVARALVKNLNTLGIDFSILGNKETCCGNEVYSLGEKGLFDILVEKNLSLLDQYGINRILTTSPHCFNAFKNKYGKDLAVQHYTQYFADLIDKGKLKFPQRVEKVVTYQDPCFLGKHNDIYDEPRKIIENIPGIKFVELNLSRGRGICCEGGGGRMWYDIPGERGRLAETRVKEAIDVGAEILAVACPFCLLTFDDAVKTTGNEDKIQIMDIMELVAEALLS
ncbi:(Fe-S)-binding protein [Candidatus Bathyarchaeota archaeon]|nr:MAG: (Fe-S)-binding protein [Candidatus Bathyarchaeota archaeon]